MTIKWQMMALIGLAFMAAMPLASHAQQITEEGEMADKKDPANPNRPAAIPMLLLKREDGPPPVVPSMFYSPDEIRQIHLAINTYIKYSNGNEKEMTADEADFLNKMAAIFGKKEVKHSAYFTYPQFFLKSIVFHSADDWSVWVNDRRITQSTPKDIGDLEVSAISSDQVRLAWRPQDMGRVNDIWSKQPNDKIEVDQIRQMVIFDLKPNQTFSSYKMDVFEGKVLPVTIGVEEEKEPPPQPQGINIQVTPAEKANPQPQTPLIRTPQPTAEPPKQQQEGFGGLMNMYKNLNQNQ
ncbi:MAG: hypothetical protein SFT92_06490 [Rickettsiales bacterium]|nr:hypothetical protein [Rickettsiales bacterium]